ncbi:MAG: lipoprotein [Kiloniellales bacterium]|jgi:predicted small lipoprotein YifL
MNVDGQAAARALIAAVILALALGACGRKGDVGPPEGQESEHTYPQIYPAPGSVLPNDTEEPDTAPPAADGDGGSSGS